MKEDLEINQDKDFVPKPKKKSQVNKWGLLIGLCFVLAGLVWYGVNLGIIPYSFLQEQAGPIILLLIGLLIVIKSF